MSDLKHVYTQHLAHMRIAILGPVPPPFGGVAVHVQRVIARLKKQGCSVSHFNTCVEYRYRFTFLYLVRLVLFLCIKRPDQVHMHTLYLTNGLRELACIMRLKKYMHFEVVLIEHDCRYLYAQSKAWKEQLHTLLPGVAKHVYIGSLTAQSFADNLCVQAPVTSVEGAFLPPDYMREQHILLTYPAELFPFLSGHKKIVLASAFALSLLNGQDLYGFDLCIKMLKVLRRKGIDVGLVFVLAQVGDQAYFAFCMHMIEQYGLREHVFVVSGQKELWPLMKLADIFIRPTLSDGASVSIEEALWCGTRVVASDVCRRPKGVVLFKTGNEQDAQRVLEGLLCDATEAAIVSEGDAKVGYISNESCNDASVDAAYRNQQQI